MTGKLLLGFLIAEVPASGRDEEKEKKKVETQIEHLNHNGSVPQITAKLLSVT